MLRSFSVVGALAAAALALVIGVFAFTSHSKQDHPPAGGAPSQSGVADHPVASTKAGQQESGPLFDFALQQQLDQERQAAAQNNSAPEGFFSGSSSSSAGASGGGGGAVARVARTCTPGLLSGLIGALGGLLGGGGSSC